MNTHVIVGAGLAGAKAAEALRTKGFGGRIVLVGDEPHRPYERPPLSKNVLIGKAAADSAYIHGESWYAAHDVDLRLGVPAATIDRTAHRVDLADGTRISYDKLLLATGARPRTLRVPGATAEGVHHLRRIEDSQRLRETVEHWANALKQPAVAAAGMLGEHAEYDELPYFYTDQYDLGMEYVGHASDYDQVVFRGDVTRREFIAFWLKDDVVVAGMNVNIWDVTDAVKGLIRSATRIDRALLSDPSVPLESLVTSRV